MEESNIGGGSRGEFFVSYGTFTLAKNAASLISLLTCDEPTLEPIPLVSSSYAAAKR
jgi:hypothetical protein